MARWAKPDSYQHASCEQNQVELGITTLSGKWTVQILWVMKDAPVRLSHLRRSHPYASKKALTASLRSLEKRGIIIRRDLSTSVLHVEYEFAEAMREPILALLESLGSLGSLL
jgi:DNA-binding HxlR family transcriptional regulator